MRNLLNYLLGSLAIISIASSQPNANRWNPVNGYAIRQASSIEFYNTVTSRTEGEFQGEFAICWSDTRNGDRDIYLQVSDQEGRLLFEDNGLTVNRAPLMQSDPAIAAGPEGSWFVAWIDFNSDSLGDIYCTKIDHEGRILWGDVESGVMPYTRNVGSSVQFDIHLVADNGGGCFLIWADQRRGDPADVYAQHILHTGEIDLSWPQDGLPVSIAAGSQQRISAISDGEGGFCVVWRDGRIAGGYGIRAQRIDEDGNDLWGNDGGVIVCEESSGTLKPQMTSDGMGGVFIVWVDLRNLQDTDYDLYAQRLSPEGMPYWSENGSPFCAVEGRQSGVKMISSERGEAIVVWGDQRSRRNFNDIYTTKIGGEDELVILWDQPTGTPVCLADNNQMDVFLISDDQGGAIIAWNDNRQFFFPENQIYIQHLGEFGERYLEADGMPIPDDSHKLFMAGIQPSPDGGFYLAETNSYSVINGVSVRKYDSQANPEWGDAGLPMASGFGGLANNSHLLRRRDGSMTVSWTDGRNAYNGIVSYMQTIDDPGDNSDAPNERYPHQGLQVGTNLRGGCSKPVACEGLDGNTIVAYQDQRLGQLYSIQVQCYSPDGEPLWEDEGDPIVETFDEQYDPFICSDGSGGAYIGLKTMMEEGDYDAILQHVSPDGQRLWGDEGLTLAASPDDEEISMMISDDTGGVIVILKQIAYDRFSDRWDDDILIERLTDEGVSLWSQSRQGAPVATATGSQRYPKIAKHPDGWAIVWQDDRYEWEQENRGNDIYGQFIDSEGNMTWGENGKLISGAPYDQNSPEVAIDTQGNIWVSWDDNSNGNIGNNIDVYCQKIAPELDENGSLQIYFRTDGLPDELQGKVVAWGAGNQRNCRLVTDGTERMWMVWEDASIDRIFGDIYAKHVDLNANALGEWTEAGRPVCDAYHRQILKDAALISNSGDAGIFVVWEDFRASGKEELQNLFIQRVDDDLAKVNSAYRTALPEAISIESVYPNPFNSDVVIGYNLDRATSYHMDLYDVQGHFVKTITGGFGIAGRYRVLFNASDLPSATYVVRLETNVAEYSQKIALVR